MGTPHIAGYSLDGKINGTLMVYEAACKHLGIPVRWKAPKDLLRLWRDKPTPEFPLVTIEERINQKIETIVARLVHQVYNIQRDDADLRKMFGLSYEQRGQYFDRLRKKYPIRREFHNTSVKLPDRAEEMKKILGGIGFKIFLIRMNWNCKDFFLHPSRSDSLHHPYKKRCFQVYPPPTKDILPHSVGLVYLKIPLVKISSPISFFSKYSVNTLVPIVFRPGDRHILRTSSRK